MQIDNTQTTVSSYDNSTNDTNGTNTTVSMTLAKVKVRVSMETVIELGN